MAVGLAEVEVGLSLMLRPGLAEALISGGPPEMGDYASDDVVDAEDGSGCCYGSRDREAHGALRERSRRKAPLGSAGGARRSRGGSGVDDDRAALLLKVSGKAVGLGKGAG
jgi:hypothetical protein